MYASLNSRLSLHLHSIRSQFTVKNNDEYPKIHGTVPFGDLKLTEVDLRRIEREMNSWCCQTLVTSIS